MPAAALLAFLVAFPAPVFGETERPPPPPVVRVCWDYGCKSHEQVRIPSGTWARVTRLLRSKTENAAEERRRLRTALTLLDRAIGRLTPVGRDLGGSYPWAGLPGQQDCIDESLTTEALLRALEQAGLLHWHRVAGRIRRAPHLFDVHWTAVIEEVGTGNRHAVDPWYGDQGDPPVIQPLPEWRKGAKPRDLPSHPGRRALAARLLRESFEEGDF